MNIKYKNAIMRRQSDNKEILRRLNDLVCLYPELRFGQILINTNVLEYVGGKIKDPYNDEPCDILKRMK